CVVYKTRAQRCYDVAALAPDLRQTMTYCKDSCEECDYFSLVHDQAINVLVVTDDRGLTSSLEQEATGAPFNLEITDCEYRCSAVVAAFRPDFAVVDCSLGLEASQDISNHLSEDPRIPFTRIILAANNGEFPDACETEVFAHLEKPFAIGDIAECIDGIQDSVLKD
ncbi:hypothetical protein ACFL59_10350, partial [Planctomycetota bacterium]